MNDLSSPGGESVTPGANRHSRRRFLGYLIGAPVLVTAAQLSSKVPAGADVISLLEGKKAAGSATALNPIPSPDQPADVTDLGDLLILAAAPTDNMIKVTVNKDGTVSFDMPREENGQGLQTGMTMLIADELDVALSAVNVTLADAEPSLLFNQITGGSSGVRTLWDPVRTACALARQQLLAAAAAHFGVPARSLTVKAGVVSTRDGRTITYGELSPMAAVSTTTAMTVTPKDPAQYQIVGTPVRNLQARDIVTGRQIYTPDLKIPGVDAMPTMVRRAPTQRGTLKAFLNPDVIRAMPGVLDVAAMSFGVAIRGRTFGQVIDAVNAVEATWNPGPVAGLDDKAIFDQLKAATQPLIVPDIPALPAGGVQSFDAEFEWGYVNHAPLEPNVAIADVHPDRAEVWSPLQNPIVALQTIAQDLGLPQSAVKVHVLRGGGSFGRTLFYDAAHEAPLISRAMGNKPVKLMWHRTNDMRQSRGHPPTYHRMRATISGGSVLSYEHRVSAVQTDINPGLGEIFTNTLKNEPGGEMGFDQTLFLTTVTCPYNFGAVTQTLDEVPVELWTASWRSVYSYDTRASEEIFVDRLAAAMGVDPLAFRMAFLKSDRIKTLLQKVATVGQWGRPMKPGTAQGLCANTRDRSFGASLVEVDATDPANPRVTKAVIAVDAVIPINPLAIEAQQIGGLNDAISVVLSAGNAIQDGLPVPDGWDQFGLARQGQSPPDVQVFVVPRAGDKPAGIGESGVPNTAGAIANAYIRATGKMPTSFPINPVVITDTTPPGQVGTQDDSPIPPANELYNY